MLHVAFEETQGGLGVDTASNDHSHLALLVLVEVFDCPFNVTNSNQLQGLFIDLLRRGSLARAVVHRVELLAVEA